MSNGEYRKTCSGCRKRGDQTFARIYPRPINNKWVWLCSSCWETPTQRAPDARKSGRKKYHPNQKVLRSPRAGNANRSAASCKRKTLMYLWSNPDLPHWQRLLLGVVYLPMLFWWWLVGNPIQLSRRTPRALDGAPLCTCKGNWYQENNPTKCGNCGKTRRQ